MRVLVTGATGFIGSHCVVQLLAAGHAVGALVRDPVKLEAVLAPHAVSVSALQVHPGDMADADWQTLLAGYDAVVHSAGLFSHLQRDADRMWQLNVVASDALLRAAVSVGLDPIIHISSFLAMFPPIGKVLRAEDPVREPKAIYTRSKAQAERDARALQAQGAPVVSVYPASVIGPLDPTVGSGPELMANYVNSGKVLVTEGGLGFTDVRDLARLIVRLLVPGQGPRRVMASEDFISHERLHQILCDASGKVLNVQRTPGWLLRTIGRLGDIKQSLGGGLPALTYEAAGVLTQCVPAEDDEARALLGDSVIGAEQGLRDMLQWMKAIGIVQA